MALDLPISSDFVLTENFSFAKHLELSISREATWPGDDFLKPCHSTSSLPPQPSPQPLTSYIQESEGNIADNPGIATRTVNTSHAAKPTLDLEEELFGLGSLTPLSSPIHSRSPSPIIPDEPRNTTLISHPCVHQAESPSHNVCPLPVESSSSKNSRQKRKERSKAQSKARKRLKRQQEAQAEFSVSARIKPVEHYVKNSVALPLDFDTAQCKHTKGAYTGLKTEYESSKIYHLSDLVGPGSKGFRLVQWDGQTPTPIIDKESRIVALLAGQPNDPNWQNMAMEGSRLMAEAQRGCRSSSRTAQESERGPFRSLRCGISHGGGQTHPQKLANDSRNERLLRKLNAAEPFRRITGFASSIFATWAPKLHEHYAQTAQQLYSKYPDLPRYFERSVFCATTYNLGPNAVCVPHVDLANLSFGWCAIAALGNFNPTKGGHLVLWNCQMVIEFPPGSLVLIPSATIAHSNTAINLDAGETRCSFTQYTAGGLFRWVENGFTVLEEYKATLGKEGLKKWNDWMEERWSFGLSLLPTHPIPPASL